VNGFKLSPVVGQWMVQFILTGMKPEDMQHFSFDRFTGGKEIRPAIHREFWGEPDKPVRNASFHLFVYCVVTRFVTSLPYDVFTTKEKKLNAFRHRSRREIP
jgi:hypothetical protein